MRRIIFSIIFLIGASVGLGCAGRTIKIFPNDNFTLKAKAKYEAALAELERNRRLWRERGIVDYDFQIGYYTGVGGTFSGALVKVRHGSMHSMEKDPKDHPGEIFQPKEVETIDKIFDLIKTELDEFNIVETKYNPQFGYPEKIRITTSDAVDASGTFDIFNFERRFESEGFENKWKSRYEETLSALNKNRLIWQANNFGDYEYFCEQFQGGTYSNWAGVLFTVRDGKPFSLEVKEREGARMDDYDKLGSIDKIFDYLRQELENGRLIDVTYHKSGYPEKIYIEYSFATDSTRYIGVSKFKVIQR